MKMMYRICVALMLTVPAPALGGGLTDFIDKAKGMAEQALQKHPPAEPAPQGTPEPQPGNAPAENEAAPGADQPAGDGYRATPGRVDLAIFHFAPEILDDESNLKRAVREIYPGEAQILDAGHEFEWNRRKDDFREKILAAAATAPVTFDVIPWPEGGDTVRLQLGTYDFNRQAFMIYPAGLRGRIRNQLGDRAFFKWRNRDPDSVKWLPMPPDRAEALFAGKTDRALYARFSYTLTRVDKSEVWRGRSDPRNWNPTVAIDAIELYAKQVDHAAKSAADFRLITTLDLSGAD